MKIELDETEFSQIMTDLKNGYTIVEEIQKQLLETTEGSITNMMGALKIGLQTLKRGITTLGGKF